MYSKTVVLEDTNRGIRIEVCVCCVPSTSEAELKQRAIEKVMNYVTGF